VCLCNKGPADSVNGVRCEPCNQGGRLRNGKFRDEAVGSLVVLQSRGHPRDKKIMYPKVHACRIRPIMSGLPAPPLSVRSESWPRYKGIPSMVGAKPWYLPTT
jgi:hypothetical protein